ncbi:hypothetical protein CHI14_21615 [Paenibacillus sp. 7516]|nr:hypothetical protein CHI14_21615 [Paenibacillus sp. 7516]
MQVPALQNRLVQMRKLPTGRPKQLPAVKNNQVYELQEDRYWYFDPIAIQGQAEEFTDMIVERTQQNRK